MKKTRKDILDDIHNETLNQWVRLQVNIALLKKEKPDKVVGRKQSKSTIANKIIVQDVTAQELIEKDTKELKDLESIVETIMALQKEEK